MKIAVIAANGKTGSLITQEAVNRGISVTAIVRKENKTLAQDVLTKDIFELTASDLVGFDAVVDAAGFWSPEDLVKHETSLKHLADILSGTEIALFVVGGAGSLYMDETHTRQLQDTLDFPKAYKPLATSMAKGLAALRQRQDVRWVYVSPAALFDAEGEKTGDYQVAGELFETNQAGESHISYADYAVGLVDAIEKGTYGRERISLLSK